MNAIKLYNIAHFFYNHNIWLIPKIVEAIIFLLYNSYIPASAQIGRGTKFAYKGMGVVLHKNAIIGQNCIISQQVTVGGKAGTNNPPRIGNNVYLAAGCKIIGDIEIGDNCVIGVNSVVNKSLPSNCIAAGVPATIIKKDIKNIRFYFP